MYEQHKRCTGQRTISIKQPIANEIAQKQQQQQIWNGTWTAHIFTVENKIKKKEKSSKTKMNINVIKKICIQTFKAVEHFLDPSKIK